MSATQIPSFELTLERLSAYFMNTSPLQDAARAIAGELERLGVDYAIAGALALAAHGLIRATEDVDVLIDRDGLARFKQACLGKGYMNVRPGGKAVRDTVHGVRIDFLIQGDFPGDGAPKPVAFPDPRDASIRMGQFQVLALPRLIELKLASGMTAPHRLQDLADVLRLVRVRGLPAEFRNQLNAYVQPKFLELWKNAQHPPDDY